MKSVIGAFVAVAVLALASPTLASGRTSTAPTIYAWSQETAIHAPRWRKSAPVIAVRAAWGGGSRVVELAAHYAGWGNPTGFRGPWCKAFTNKILREAGYHPGPSLRAIDALAVGQRVSAPQPGDLAVMRGHVTFFAQWDGPDAFDGLGGNQGHAVRLSRFWRGAVIAWVRPR